MYTKYCNHILFFCLFIVVGRRHFQNSPIIIVAAEANAKIIKLAEKRGVDKKLLVQVSQEFQNKIEELQLPTNVQPSPPATIQPPSSTIVQLPSPTVQSPVANTSSSKGNKNYCKKCGGEIFCISAST